MNNNKSTVKDSRTLEQLEQDIRMVIYSKIANDEKDKKIVKLEKIYRRNGGTKSLSKIIN